MARETNPEAGSHIEMEPDGDFTITFEAWGPTPPAADDQRDN